MKLFFTPVLLLIVLHAEALPDVCVCSWDLKDFGKTKTTSQLMFIAKLVKKYDIIAIQKVMAGYGGTQAVAALSDELNRQGDKWDYSISDPTYSSSYKQEKYAYTWRAGKIKKKGAAWLERLYQLEIDREPYFATFLFEEKEFTLVNFQANTKYKQPETEIKFFKFLPSEYPGLNLIFAGDFNCPQSNTVLKPLKSMGYRPAFTGQKATIRYKCINEDCLASEFDNFYYPVSKITVIESGDVLFYKFCNSLEEANGLKDHLPVYLTSSLN